MAKCCVGDPWTSTIDGNPDGTLTIDFEDPNTGDITGDHHDRIRNGTCKNKKVHYETSKNGVLFVYDGKANNDCTEIKGTRSKRRGPPIGDDDEVWVATKGGGQDTGPGQNPRQDENRDYGSRQS